MARVLETKDVVSAIVNYVSDERNNQAVLLDGEWGSGKTFFVKEYLLPVLRKLEEVEIQTISLYGVSSVEKIQEMIFAQWLEDHIDGMTGKLGKAGHALNKGISVLGRPAIGLLEKILGVESSSIADAATSVIDGISKKGKNIIVFDDIERCRVDIIQLMGFLNNLSENNGYKLILVANEKEISRIENPTEEALKYLVALRGREIIASDVNDDKTNRKISNADLKKSVLGIFGEESLYERTREKLIGLTVPYNVSVEDVFEPIVNKYIRNKNIQTRVLQNKERITEILDQNKHNNLRTLIAACLAIEDIVSSIDEKVFLDKEMLHEEINSVIAYAVFSSIRRSTGKKTIHWTSNTRYGSVDCRPTGMNHSKVYGYAFVDEYWKTLCVDRDVVTKDLQDRIDYRCENERSERKAQEYKNLALFKLEEWYMLEDNAVQELVQRMKEELEAKKYLPSEFKEIVCILMRINNKNFGLGYDGSNNNVSNSVYDTEEVGRFVGMEYAEEKELAHSYADWDRFEIPQFVDRMVSYFDDREFVLTNEMIRVLSEDKQYAYNYRLFTEPLRDMIKEHDLKMSFNNASGMSISDIPWDGSLGNMFKEKKQEFIRQGRFFSLLDYSKITSHILSATAQEIHVFCDAIKCVYSFSDLVSVFSEDLESLDSVISFIDENVGKKINPEKSRTKEIAIRRLYVDLKKYKMKLECVV